MKRIHGIFTHTVYTNDMEINGVPVMAASESIVLQSGTLIPKMGIGTWGMNGHEEQAVRWALEAGYRHVDTAKVYGTEEGIARAIAASGIPREEIFITTKLWNEDQGYASALRAIEGSLTRLNTQYVDLYLIHWPLTEETEGENLREETWKAMEKIYDAGKARAIGVSNFGVLNLVEMEHYARIPPAVNQIQRHPFLQQRDVAEYCNDVGIAVTNYSPLTRAKKLSDSTVTRIAEKYDVSSAQILLRWGLEHGNIVIPRSVQKAHIEENLRALTFKLGADDMRILDTLDEGLSVT